MKKPVLLFVFEGYADWEPSYAIAEINKSELYEVKTFSAGKKPVRSLGGLTILPDMSITDAAFVDPAMLILPGGARWEEKNNQEIEPLISKLLENDVLIAAICAATTFLADQGLLDEVNHTSNSREYLQELSPLYRGHDRYQDAPSVTDGRIITANGTAATEFARDIFSLLAIYDEEAAGQWFQAFKYGIV